MHAAVVNLAVHIFTSPIWATPRAQACVLIGALFIFLLPFQRSFERTGLNMDEGMLLVYPEQVLKGKLPYRDFETFYGPANLFVLAGTYAVAGVSINTERTVGLLYRAILLVGIFFVVRRWSLVAAVAGMLFAAAFFLINGLIAVAWYGGVACLLWSLILLAGKGGRWRTAGAGILAAGSLLFRVDLGPAVILSTLPLWLWLPPRLRWTYLVGFAAGLLPLLVLLPVVGPRPLWENLFLYPVLICNPGRRLPFSLLDRDLFFVLSAHALGALAGIAAGLWALRAERSSHDARLFFSTALLAAGLTYQTLQRADVPHVLSTSFLSVALLPAAALLLWQRGRVGSGAAWKAASCSAVLALAFHFGARPLLQIFGHEIVRTVTMVPQEENIVRVRDREFRPSGPIPAIQTMLTFIEKNSRPGQRLFVGTGDLRRTFAADTFCYYLLPWLTPATYFLEMNPLSANRPNSRLAADVASADWLILNEAWDAPNEPNLSGQNGSDAPNQVVREQFELRGRISAFRVYSRKGMMPARAAGGPQ